MSQVIDLKTTKSTLTLLGKQLMNSQYLQSDFEIIQIVLHVRTIHQNIIKKKKEKSNEFPQIRPENVIHQALERGWCIS